ncbi:hypothetical protein WJX74_000448 [Apatococcus lobatus]|uniref:Uncharacterized protein n=1 Tax=Apatococcus lobatus TaxID=904363 RepID=A0AAW1QZG8_9CHLO
MEKTPGATRSASLVPLASSVMGLSLEAAAEVVRQVINAYPDLEKGLVIYADGRPRVPEKQGALFVCRLLGEVGMLYKVKVLEGLGFERNAISAAATSTFRLPIAPLFNFRPVSPKQLAPLPSLSFQGLPTRMTLYDFRLLCVGNRGYYACSMQPDRGSGHCWFLRQADAVEAQNRLGAVSLSPSAPCPLLIKLCPCWAGDQHMIPPAFL